MKRLWFSILGVIAVGIFAACGQSSTANEKLKKDETPFTWWSERTQDFGQSDYTGNEEESKADLLEKYQLKLLPSFEQIENRIKEEFEGAALVLEEPVYEIYAADKELAFRGMLSFIDEHTCRVYSELKSEYVYLAEQQQVKVKRQQLELKLGTERKSYYGKDFSVFIKELGAILKIPEKSAAKFQKQLENPEELSNQTITIYDDHSSGEKNGLFGKALRVAFSEEGLPKTIYAYTVDYRQ